MKVEKEKGRAKYFRQHSGTYKFIRFARFFFLIRHKFSLFSTRYDFELNTRRLPAFPVKSPNAMFEGLTSLMLCL